MATKSLAEIAADVTSWLGGRKMDLSQHDFDSLSILQKSGQSVNVEMSVEELRAMLKDQKGRASWD